MVLSIKVTGSIIESMVLGNTSGKMEESTTEIGTIMICTVWESTFIPMELPTKDNTKRTRKLDMVSISGLMEGSMKVGGTMVNSMDLESTRIQAKER